MAVQVVAVGDDHEGRILKRRSLPNGHHIEDRQQGFSRSLGKPDHPAFAILLVQVGIQGAFDGFQDPVILMPLGNDLDGRSAILRHEQDKAFEEVQQGLGVHPSTGQYFKLQHPFRRFLVIDQAPRGVVPVVSGQ